MISKSKVLNVPLIILFCLGGYLSYSQVKTIGLKDALKLAETNYPEIRAKKLYSKAYEKSVSATKLEYLPSVKLHAQMDYATANSLAGAYFPLGVVVPISGAINPAGNSTPVYGNIGMAYLEWTPITFGQHAAKVQLANAELQTANADYDNEKFQQLLKVTAAYIDFLTIYKLRISQEKYLTRALAIQKVVHATVINGLKPGVDSSFANAEVSKAKLSLMDYQKSENDAQNQLANLIGANSNDFIPDTLSLTQNIPAILNTPVDEKNNPELKLFESRENMGISSEKYIRRSYMPKISVLGGAWERGSGLSPDKNSENDYSFAGGNAYTRYNYAVGLALTFTISDFPRINALAASEHFRTEGYREEYEGAKQELQNQLTLADKNINLAILQSKEVPVQLTAANAGYTQKLVMYNNGLTDIADLAQALYNLNRAETDAAISTNNIWKALLYKANATGDLSIFLNL